MSKYYAAQNKYDLAIIYRDSLTLSRQAEREQNSAAKLLYAKQQQDRLQIQVNEKQISMQRLLLLGAIIICALLAIALGIWIYLNRKIARKNRTLAQQIKELIAQQEARDAEILAKTSFIPEEKREENTDDFLCPESRMDKLCIAIRDALLKDKAYRNPALTRDQMIEHLGTNRELFIEAFRYCFHTSFIDYVNNLRLKDVITLLEQSDLSIEVISEKTGFGTLRTFQRQFHAKYNMTPKDYRKSARKS